MSAGWKALDKQNSSLPLDLSKEDNLDDP